jgi:hypothetical protein
LFLAEEKKGIRCFWYICKKLKSIVNATDPLNNSINEKCARIREAFLLKFHEGLAENYFVTGKTGRTQNDKTIKRLNKMGGMKL